jgi:hypothetical protein
MTYELTCVVCGGPFTAAAANAKVCGDGCRRKRRAEQSQASYERTGRKRRRDRLAADPAAREANRDGVRRWRQANADKAREQTRQAARRFRSSPATAASDPPPPATMLPDPTAADGEPVPSSPAAAGGSTRDGCTPIAARVTMRA